jgi:hypothetical protein
MSLLSPQVHAELAQLLQALQSSDNSIRSQAEEHLTNNWTNSQPEVLLMGLVEQICGSTETTVRTSFIYSRGAFSAFSAFSLFSAFRSPKSLI